MSYSTSRGAAAPASGSLRRPLTAVLAVAALLTGALAIAPAAQAAPTASLSGTVTMPGDIPVADTWVALYEVDGTSEGDFVDEIDVYVEDDGAYVFDDLEPGTYTIRTSEDDYETQYAGGAADARYAAKVTLAENQDGVLDMVLSEGRTVSGRVLDQHGQPVDSEVGLHRKHVYDGGWEFECCDDDDTYTYENGVYEFENVLAGEYTVSVASDDDSHLGRWYGNVSDIDVEIGEAEPKFFVVTAGSDKDGIDVTSPLGGRIAGTVRGANGQPLDDVYVEGILLLKDPWGQTMPFNYWDTSDYTDEYGTFSIDRLEAGTYALWFGDEAGEYPEQFLGGVTGLGGAKTVSVALGSATNVNATLTTKPFVSPSTPSITLSPAKRAYGKASTATVKVTPTKKGVTATGTVTLKDGTKVLGTKTLAGGKATFDLPKDLTVGTHSLTASFATNGTVQSSVSAPVTLTVTKATAKLKTKVNKAKTDVVVNVKSAAKATGKVVLKRGKKTLDSAKLKKRKATLSLEGLDAGKNKLRVIYQGSKTVKSAKKKVTVKIA